MAKEKLNPVKKPLQDFYIFSKSKTLLFTETPYKFE